jgi:hypothetical protein
VGRKAILLIAFVIIVVLAVFNISLIKNKSPSAPVPEAVIPLVEASETTSMDSPDGKLTLVVKTTKNGDVVTYTFSISGKEIFVKTVDASITISIPYNTWSPDNKYVFLKEGGEAGASYFVLFVLKDSSSQNDQTANINDLFAKKYSDLKIADVTGWGGINLVIVNSLKNDGAKGPSFWFEMPSHSFIQLSTHF